MPRPFGGEDPRLPGVQDPLLPGAPAEIVEETIVPRFLALDLDQKQARIVAGTADKRSSRVEKTAVWNLPADPVPKNGESLGKNLREFLRSAGIAPAPLLACIGRDRMILKVVRFPAVAEHEEPALVRFQAAKELTDAPSEVVLDYFVLKGEPEGNQKQAIVLVVRKEVVRFLSALCLGLGVKPAGILPRPLALAAALERVEPAALDQALLLHPEERGADLCLIEQGQVRFARWLMRSPDLPQDVRRSLTLLATQERTLPSREVLLLGDPETTLADGLAGPAGWTLRKVDPWLPGDDKPAGVSGAWAAAVGLVHLAGKGIPPAVDFLKPKEPRPPRKVGIAGRKVLVGGAAVLMLLLLVAGYLAISRKSARLAQLKEDRAAVEEDLKKFGVLLPDIKVYREWQDGTISWVDEFYDLAARFPHEQGVRVTQVAASLNTRPKDKYVGKMSVQGVVPAGKDGLVSQFLGAINQDESKHLRATLERIKGTGTGHAFTLKVDLTRQDPLKFETPLKVPETTGKGRPRGRAAAPPDPAREAEEPTAAPVVEEGGRP